MRVSVTNARGKWLIIDCEYGFTVVKEGTSGEYGLPLQFQDCQEALDYVEFKGWLVCNLPASECSAHFLSLSVDKNYAE